MLTDKLVFMLVAIFFVAFVIALATDALVKPSIQPTCQEDQALYPMTDGRLDYPDGKLACINIDDF